MPATTVTPPSPPATQSSPSTQAKTDGRAYVVRAGDTLSAIAKREHVKGGWRSLYKRNRDVVGPNPNLILPGQRLSL
jgi:nucleoid-associated protein YgaU